jgi:hypothetical protein
MTGVNLPKWLLRVGADVQAIWISLRETLGGSGSRRL